MAYLNINIMHIFNLPFLTFFFAFPRRNIIMALLTNETKLFGMETELSPGTKNCESFLVKN